MPATIGNWSLRGRISRGVFWMRALLVWSALMALQAMLSGSSVIFMAMVSLLALMALLNLCIQRLHDRGYSAVWLMVVFVPVLGALWLIWQLAFKAGQGSDNSWGPAQRRQQKDFLVVQS